MHLIESIVERKPEPKKFKVGPIESDSGNHLVDIFTVMIGVAILIFLKKMIGK